MGASLHRSTTWLTMAPCSLMLSPSVREVLALLVGGGVTATGVIVLLRAPGPVAKPVPDRWHRKATPLIGGSGSARSSQASTRSAALRQSVRGRRLIVRHLGS